MNFLSLVSRFLAVGDFDVAPEAEFPGPIVGAVFEGEVDGFSGEFGEVEFEFEPFGLDGLVRDELIVKDFVVGEDSELPVTMRMVAAAEFEGVFFTGGKVDAAGEAAGCVFAEGVSLDGFFVTETLEGDDSAFADVFNGEARGDRCDGFIPIGAKGLICVLGVLGGAAGHTTSDAFLEEREFALDGDF